MDVCLECMMYVSEGGVGELDCIVSVSVSVAVSVSVSLSERARESE